MLLVIESNLFPIGTIILQKPKILVVVVVDAKIIIDTKIGTNTEIDIGIKIDIKILIFDFPHTLGEISINTHASKMQDMKIAKWNI
jgi:hypothetical protein